MDAKEFKKRTMDFTCSVMDLVEAMPTKLSAAVIGKQLLRSATSVGANYRAACRAKSPSDFIYKLGIVEEEIDESAYWLELIERKSLAKPSSLKSLQREAEEITAMIVASINTARHTRGLKRWSPSGFSADLEVPASRQGCESRLAIRQSAIRNPRSAMT
jgi:four helix bundle protein